MKRAALLLTLAIVACSPASETASPNGSAAAPATPGVPAYALRSNVPGASLVRLAELATVKPLKPDSYCTENVIQPASDAGKLAAAKGWTILNEKKFHDLQVVLIVRGLEGMTSGRCRSIDANIAFFDGTRLVGVLYPKSEQGIAIATMTLDDGHLRVWSPDPMLQGQVNLNGEKLTFDKVTGSEAVCNGKYRLPALYTLPYGEVRAKLLAAGWVATPSKEETDALDITAEYRKRVPEVDHCAGTGYGECAYTLAAADGDATLSVLTLGGPDDAVVSDYDVACDGKAEAK